MASDLVSIHLCNVIEKGPLLFASMTPLFLDESMWDSKRWATIVGYSETTIGQQCIGADRFGGL